MRIQASSFYHSSSFYRFLGMAIFCSTVLAPQNIFSQPNEYSVVQKEKNSKFFPNLKAVEEVSIDSEDLPSAPRPAVIAKKFRFPKFKDSLMRHPTNLAKYNKIYEVNSDDPAVLEFRKAADNFESIYTKNILLFTHDQEAPTRIPKVIHQIWLGSKVPEKFFKWMSSWANMQGWEYKLWTDKEVKEFPLFNRELYDKAKDFGEKADILRYEILYQEGGLYADVDFENINTELFTQLNKSYDFYAGIEPMSHRQPVNSPVIGNAIFASIPGHPILEDIIFKMQNHYQEHDAKWAVVCTGPVLFTETINEHLQSIAEDYIDIVFPPTFFFPLSYSDVRKGVESNLAKYIKPETAAVHYWSSSWIEPKDENPPKEQSRSKKKSKRNRH